MERGRKAGKGGREGEMERGRGREGKKEQGKEGGTRKEEAKVRGKEAMISSRD